MEKLVKKIEASKIDASTAYVAGISLVVFGVVTLVIANFVF